MVVRDHREHDRQREVGVVHAALLAHRAVLRVGLAAFAHRLDHAALAGDDHVQDVRAHDRAEDGAVVDEGAAAAEDLHQPPGSRGEETEQHNGECALVEGRTAQAFVNREAEHERADADADRGAFGERHHRGVDQVELGVDVVHEHEQREARNPGPVRLPLEPVQCRRQLRRPELVLLGAVEAAAVDRPELAGEPRVPGRLETIVEPDEIERGADPGDADDDMRPAQQQVQPVEEIGLQARRRRGSKSSPTACI